MTLSEDAFRDLVAVTARSLVALDGVLEADDLVEPTGKYFPDEFSLQAEPIAKLVIRMRGYTPLSADMPLGVAFTEPEGEQASGGGCGGGACATPGAEAHVARGGFQEMEDGYAVVIDVRDAPEPALLTGSIARSLGGIVLAESEADVELDASGFGFAAEMCATAMGLGVIVAASSCVYKKGCGGMKMHRGTHASLEETVTALALYCRTRGISPSRARGHLEITQREAFDEAVRLVDGNDHVTSALREHPETLVDGAFQVRGPKGLLGRLFGKKEPSIADAAPQSERKKRSAEEDARIAEAKRLVEEAFEGS
jgi:hypothetical protein